MSNKIKKSNINRLKQKYRFKVIGIWDEYPVMTLLDMKTEISDDKTWKNGHYNWHTPLFVFNYWDEPKKTISIPLYTLINSIESWLNYFEKFVEPTNYDWKKWKKAQTLQIYSSLVQSYFYDYIIENRIVDVNSIFNEKISRYKKIFDIN